MSERCERWRGSVLASSGRSKWERCHGADRGDLSSRVGELYDVGVEGALCMRSGVDWMRMKGGLLCCDRSAAGRGSDGAGE